MGRPRKWPKSRTGGGVDGEMPDQVGQDVDEVGHDGERDEAGREDRRGFPIDVGDD